MGSPQNGEADFVGKRRNSGASHCSDFEEIGTSDATLVPTPVCATFGKVPYLVVVLLDSAVAGEEAAVGHVEDSLLCPELFVPVLTVGLLVDGAVGPEVPYHHELVGHAVVAEYQRLVQVIV